MKPRTTYICPKCGQHVTKVPISDYRESSKVWHIQHFGRARCDGCGWESEPFEERD